MDTQGDIVLGVQRSSLLKNPLLKKSELGKPLTRCHTLPAKDFIYGQRSNDKDTSTAEAMSSWDPNASKCNAKYGKKFVKDFKALNKASTQAGMVTASEETQYRAAHHTRKPATSAQQIYKPKRLPPNMVFGLPTQRSLTPVYDLLENRYQDKWLQDRKRVEMNARAKIIVQKRIGSGKDYSETRASMLRRYSPAVDAAPLWQMNRFKKIPSLLETFRNEKSKKDAFEHYATDCTARSGVFGHGIYEAAKN